MWAINGRITSEQREAGCSPKYNIAWVIGMNYPPPLVPLIGPPLLPK